MIARRCIGLARTKGDYRPALEQGRGGRGGGYEEAADEKGRDGGGDGAKTLCCHVVSPEFLTGTLAGRRRLVAACLSSTPAGTAAIAGSTSVSIIDKHAPCRDGRGKSGLEPRGFGGWREKRSGLMRR